jgi:hypothetical protein
MDDIVDVVNLTGHPVDLADQNERGRIVTLEPSGARPPRADIAEVVIGTIRLGVVTLPLLWRPLRGTIDLPPAVPGRLLIVSNLVVLAEPGREDLVFPAQYARDTAGKIVAARALARP